MRGFWLKTLTASAAVLISSTSIIRNGPRRSDKAKGFEVLPRRWVVDRTFAWLGRCRRLAKDVERSIASAEAWIMIAHTRLITRRLAKYGDR